MEDAGIRFGQRGAGRLRVGERIGDSCGLGALRRQHGWSVKQFSCAVNPIRREEGVFVWDLLGR